MQKLYVANCSKADFQFTYMLPENLRPFLHHIRAGGQVVINGSTSDIESILHQHAPYGFMEAGKVKKGFGGVCYRLDKPINIDAIEQGLSQTDAEQIERAQNARNVTAAAQDQIITQKAQELGMKTKSGIEFEVVEEKKNAADTGDKFSQVVEVVHEGVAPKRGRGRK